MAPHSVPEILAAIEQHGTKAAAARALGIPRETLRDRLRASEYSLPEGQAIKGESVLLDQHGQVKARWVKTGEASKGDLAKALEARFAAYDGAAPLIPAPERADAETLTVYPIADLHIGMRSWGRETGANYDVPIARDLARRSVGALVAKSEPSARGVLLILGDYTHQNDAKNATPASGHILDVDGRWEYVYGAAAELATDLVEIAAQKHRDVEVVVIPGNHDPDAAITLRVALSLFYRNNPRISVYREPGLHWYARHGKVLLGATHGHTMRPDRMAMMLACDRPKDWGETAFRHFFFGHIHHETAKEVGGVRVESFSTLAARDAYAQGGGWRAGRALNAITFHAEHGEVSRHRVNVL